MTQQRRTRGTGAVFYSASQNLWVAEFDIGYEDGRRRRRRVTGRTAEIVEAKLDALRALPPEMHRPLPRPASGRSRSELLAEADARATHTTAQWEAKLLAVGCCIYCGTDGPLGMDHATPLSRGGSNGIDNVVPACPSCNSVKHGRTAAEFLRERLLGVA